MKYSEPALRASESTLIQVAMLADRVDATHRLYYGEPDLPTPDFICEAATEAMKAGHLYYTPTAGYAELKEAIADHINQLHAVRYKPSEVVTTVGAGMAIFLVIAASVEPGDNVVIVAPAFSVFASTVQLFDGEVRQVPLALDGDRFRLDMEALQAAVDDRTKLVVVNSPSNPTGWVITEQEQLSLWALVVERDILLVSDEVYERIVFDSAVAPSFSRIATDREHLLLINSFSKTYNMTGWRLGYALGDERLIGLMAKVEEFIISSPPAMIQQAGIAALRHGEDHIQRMQEQYRTRRDLVLGKLSGMPRLTIPQPDGAFYVFPKVEGLEDSMGFARRLMEETGVGVAPGSAFGPHGEGHIRICFANTPERLDEALDMLEEFLLREPSPTTTGS